jgi:hypothetical protein
VLSEGTMNGKSLIAAVLWLLLATACDENSPTAPTVPLEQRFTLTPGHAAAVRGTSLRVHFLGVSGDSRCPADVLCILGGDALVHIRAEVQGVAADYELHTGYSARARASHTGFWIELATLEPYPFSSRTIQPEEYRATLIVSR